MFLLMGLLLLAAVLQQSLGQVEHGEIGADQQKEILDKHNAIRRKVKPPAKNMLKVTWNEKAAMSAKKWAKQCKKVISPKEKRIVDGIPCGENLFEATHPTTWSDVIQKWGSKESNFKYNFGPRYGKNESDVYTQLIWYNSHMVGCGFAYCPELTLPYYYVCHYCPEGNLVTKLRQPYKNGQSCGDCPGNCEHKLCTNPCKYVDRIFDCEMLKAMASCTEDLLKENCQATCKCPTEIK
ncbi:serotriflin-like [Rhineura floridana]|uniref:serotriflin-like n=1 Tax=Rhineura floridana TaxID=261503 RepID=UPI002AC8544A|nr:serotriflin-like [Rhineura floridana]